MNTELLGHAPTGPQQQFQSGRTVTQDWHASTTDNGLGRDCEPLVDQENISLAMRQFYQSPVRSTG
jgi:hypothetical protein